MSLMWGIYRQDSVRAEGQALRAQGKARSVELRLKVLEDRLDSLALVCQAQWELLRDNTDLTDQDIERKALEIDLRDGRADGRLGGTSRPCPKCKRPLHKRHARCIYCGEQFPAEHVFSV
jgi:hypothetical protein